MAGKRQRVVEGRAGGAQLPHPPLKLPSPPPSRDWGWGLGGGGKGLVAQASLPAEALAPSPNNLLTTLPLAPGQAALVWGEQVRYLAAAAIAWGVGRGARVLVVDAANRFDPYALVREARRRGISPAAALSRVQVARAFTCHQLVRLVQEELTPRLAPGSLVVMLGPVSLFYDEQVPLTERRRLFRTLVAVLTAVKRRHPLLLLQPLLPPGAPNRGFGRLLAPLMNYLIESVGARHAVPPIVVPPTKQR